MKAISLLSLFVALAGTGVNTAYGEYEAHGLYGNTGRYGVDANTQSQLSQILNLANSCGVPLNVDPTAFAAAPPVQPLPPAQPFAIDPGALPGALPNIPAVDQPGINTGNPDNGAPTVSEQGGTGEGDTGGDTGGGDTGGGDTGGADEQSATDRAAFKPSVESIVQNTCLSCHGPGGGKSQRTAASLLAALESRGSELANKMMGFGASLSQADLDNIKNFAGK